MGFFLFGQAPVASAHPLGNATVNHYDGLELFPDKILDHAVEDIAEIPTFQRKGDIDTSGDGQLSDDERATYAAAQCADMARTVRVVVDGARVSFSVLSSAYGEKPGQVGLTSGRLECELSGPAQLTSTSQVDVESTWDDDGIGWHEITAIGNGVSLKNSPFPATSVSDALRAYPKDLLTSPLDVRRGSFTTVPGGGGSTYDAVKDLPVAGPVARALNDLSRYFNDQVGAERLTLGVGVLALVLSVALGAGHAFLPGHGKTIMAAYLVSRRGTLRDVVTVGATVTITHTAGVLLLGLAITTTTAFAPATAEKYLGVVSGGIVAMVGVFLLVSAFRRRRSPVLALQPVREPVSVTAGAALPREVDHPHHDDHGHNDHGHDDHGHDHPHHDGHDHPHAEHEHPHQDHDHPHTPAAGHKHGLFGGHGHSHGPDGSHEGFGRGGLIGLGVAGGLVPSPSALLVLLAATALGRTYFGIGLVLGYGLGMALALSVAGILLVKLRGRIDRWTAGRGFARASRLAALLPVLTALLVLAVGVGLAVRALGGQV